MVNTPSLTYAARTLSAGEAFQSKTSHAHSSFVQQSCIAKNIINERMLNIDVNNVLMVCAKEQYSHNTSVARILQWGSENDVTFYDIIFIIIGVFTLLSQESDQCAIRARLGVAGHLSTTPRWGNSVKCLS